MRDDGWLVVDTERRRVAYYGGLKLEGLSAEEAHVMLGLVEAQERASAAEAQAVIPATLGVSRIVAGAHA